MSFRSLSLFLLLNNIYVVHHTIMCIFVFLSCPISPLNYLHSFSFIFLVVYPLIPDTSLAGETLLESILNVLPTYTAPSHLYSYTKLLLFSQIQYVFCFLPLCAFALSWDNFLYPTPPPFFVAISYLFFKH